MEKPLLIYDGECRFCCRWIAVWKEISGEQVDYEASQTASARFPEIAPEEFARSVQWIGVDGSRRSGAKAVFLALATAAWYGRIGLWAYHRLPGFAPVTEALYRFVASHREGFSLLTTWSWGNDVRRPTYAFSSWLFLRILALIYLVAFVSYGLQVEGLLGSDGIFPAQAVLETARASASDGHYWPSLFLWTGADDPMLHGVCWLGGLAAMALLTGVLPVLALFVAWAAYLSLVIVGGPFYQFQWDYLLLETGFLAIFLAPWIAWSGRASPPPRMAHFLMIWLLFRLMFSSGVVKLSSGDPTWAEAAALDFHYFTQPLPTPLAWYAQQLPSGFQWLSVKLMFGIELVSPFLLFGPRRLRLAGALAIAILQVLIALTGNYGFFNGLTLALCLLVVDDHVWGRLAWRRRSRSPQRFLSRWLLGPIAAAILLLSFVPLSTAFRWPVFQVQSGPLRLLVEAYSAIHPFRSLNSYGLFAVMTTERREILVQGSEDGLDWKTYAFRYKPGAVDRAPPWVAPHMPRLDWQMWFAALGRVEQNPWFQNFVLRLLQGSPAVLSLLEENPFPESPPRYVRAVTDAYRFSTAAEARETGAWWVSEPQAIYFQKASLAAP